MIGLIVACLPIGILLWWGTNALRHPETTFFHEMFQSGETGAAAPTQDERSWYQRMFAGNKRASSSGTDQKQRSVADAGQIHLLYVTNPATDGRMGLSSRLFVTREAPNIVSAKLMTDVGKQMEVSLNEGLRYVGKLPRAWEKEFSIRLSFEDKFTSKDGGSAGTGFTVAMLAAIQNIALDPDVAVTGDLTVDGSVQPVGGVVEKLRGAIVGKCKITMLPQRNSRDVTDMALLDGTSPLWETQIFSIGTIEQALSLARRDRAPKTQDAIARFQALRARLPRTVTPNYLMSPVVQAELEQVLRDAPNHLSAATLLRATENQLPRELSLNRSVDDILAISHLFVNGVINPEKGLRSNSGSPGLTVFPEREYADCVRKLQHITPILDRRALELKSCCIAYMAAFRAVCTYRPPKVNTIRSQQQWADVSRGENRFLAQASEDLEDSRSRLLLSLRKLDADGSLMSELLTQ